MHFEVYRNFCGNILFWIALNVQAIGIKECCSHFHPCLQGNTLGFWWLFLLWFIWNNAFLYGCDNVNQFSFGAMKSWTKLTAQWNLFYTQCVWNTLALPKEDRWALEESINSLSFPSIVISCCVINNYIIQEISCKTFNERLINSCSGYF